MTTRALLALALLLAVLAGCGGSSSSKQPANPNAKESSPPGDIPDNQAYVAFTPPAALFVCRATQKSGQSSEMTILAT